MEVNGYHPPFGYQIFSFVSNLYRFGTTWGRVNNDRIVIFGWIVPLTVPRIHFTTYVRLVSVLWSDSSDLKSHLWNGFFKSELAGIGVIYKYIDLKQAAYLSKQNTQIETQTKVKHCIHMQVPDRMSVLTLLMSALSVGNVSACPHTTPIISLSWAPPLQCFSFPWPSGHTTSWDIAHTPSPYLKPFDIQTQIHTYKGV